MAASMKHPFTPDYHPELLHPKTVDEVVRLARCITRDIRAAGDQHVAQVVAPELVKRGQKLACGPECDVCCHFLVLTHRFSGVVFAAELVARDDWPARERVYAHAAQVGPAVAGLTVPEAVKVWTPRRIPCPLLVGRRCSVYFARAPICAGLLALEKRCQHGVEDQPEQVVDHRILAPVEAAADELWHDRVGQPEGAIPLSVAMVEADELLDRLAGV
jgi:hypothetical protein